MKVYIIQHVDFEKPGFILDWVYENNHTVSYSFLYENQLLPDLNDFDLLIILGGPMSVNDINIHLWLTVELEFIKKCVAQQKSILGICLGAQLIASALDAKVYKGPHKEIGWFPVSWKYKIINDIPEESTVFHWHGDTFDVPQGARHIASTEGITNQAFIYNNTIIGLQFHLEVTPESVEFMIQNCSSEIVQGRYIQTIEQIRANHVNIEKNKYLLFSILNNLSNSINL
jgi:GMP synthase-like glutamine amidotransferase